MTGLKKKTLNGLFWSAIDGYGGYILKFGISISIARLLEPEDYGLIGLMAIFMALATMFADGGFQDALVQKKHPTQEDYSSVFIFKIVVASVLYIVLFFSAGYIASFYNEPRLVLITRVMGLSFLFSGLGGIHVAWYVKNLKLKSYAKINTASTMLSGLIGLATAYLGYGVWALIIQTLSGNFIRTASLWIFNKWRPSLEFSISSMKRLFSFGWKMFVQKFIHTTFANIYYPLIGKLFPINILGFYTLARRFQVLVVDQTWLTFSKVLFPVFSSIQDDKQRFNNAFVKSFNLMAFIIYPVITILILTAEPFINFFLTSKWLPAVPFMQIMYTTGYLAPFIMINLSAVNAQGRSDITLKLNIIIRLIVIAAIAVSINYGVIYLLIAMVIVNIIAFIITAYVCGKRLEFGLILQLKSIGPSVIISLITLLSGYLITYFSNLNDLILIILQTTCVLLFYFSFMRGFKPVSYIELRELVSPRLPKKIRDLL